MKTTKIKIVTGLFSIALGVCMQFSCVDDIQFGDSFLEKEPGVDVTIDTVFSKAEYARYFLWNLYSQINSPFSGHNQLNNAPIETLSDIFHAHGTWSWSYEYYYPGYPNEDSQGAWIRDKFAFNARSNYSIWIALRKGWIFIENIDRVPDMTDAEKSRLRGEAYCIMASRYIDGLKNFGGMPLVDHAFNSDEFYERGRGTVEQTVDFIDSLLTCAIDEPGLPWREEDQQTWAGRITKSVAYALRANLYWFAASPLFNDTQPYLAYNEDEEKREPGQDNLHIWYGGYRPELWQKARSACEDFFRLNTQNGSWYAMIQPATQDEAGYCYAFRAAYWYRGNSEKIFEVHQTYTMGEWTDQNVGIGNVAHQGFTNPTVQYMEMFPMQDGRNYPYKNIYGTNNPDNIDIMANRDPRLYETLLVTREWLLDDYMNLRTVELWEGGNKDHNSNLNGWASFRFPTGMALFKWILDFWKMGSTPSSYSYLRMADMHLTYAECLAETGDLPAALEEVNKVRARVGLGKIEVMNPELNLTTNKENLIKEILRERACELGMEDKRLYDIIRRKEVDKFTTVLNELVTWRKTADGQKDTSANTQWDRNTEPWPNFIYEIRPITAGARRWWDPGFWTNKWFLSPLPREEINKGYGLTQNPGW